MISRSKKYRKSIEGFSPDEALPLSDALQKLNQFEKVNFEKNSDVKIIFVVSQEKFFSRHIVVSQQGPSVVKLCSIISTYRYISITQIISVSRE